MPERSKDYIKENKKPNGYQSLHETIYGEHARRVLTGTTTRHTPRSSCAACMAPSCLSSVASGVSCLLLT